MTSTAATAFAVNQLGDPTGQTTVYNDTHGNQATDNMQSGYVIFEGAQLSIFQGTRTDANGTSPAAGSNLFYNPKGDLSLVKRGDLTAGDTQLLTAYDGTVVLNVAFTRPPETIYPYLTSAQPTFYLNTLNGNPILSYSRAIHDFSILGGYIQPVSDSFPPRTATHYTVQTGDTFASIAQRFYSDSGFASAIAYANGYSPGSTPTVGTNLNLPPCLPTHNHYGEYRPYDQFVNTLIGNIYPALQTPLPRAASHHHSWWKTIIEVGVAVLVSYLVPEISGLIWANLALGLSAATEAFITTAVMGAMTSAASQGVTIALHDQRVFSWKSVIDNTVLAAATEGISNEEGLGAITSTSLVNQSFKQVTENFSMKLLAANLQLAGQTAMIEQLTDFALSKHRKFDWNMLLDTMVTNALSQTTAKVFGAISPVTVEINSVTSSLLNQAFLNQRFNVFEVEAAAVGTFIGNEGGKSLNDTIKPYTDAAKAAQAQKRRQQTLLKNLNTLGEIFGEEGANDVASTTPSSSTTPTTTKPASTTQQGLNQFGLFGSGSKKTPSQINQDNQLANDVAAMVSFYDGNVPGYPGGGTGMASSNSQMSFDQAYDAYMNSPQPDLGVVKSFDPEAYLLGGVGGFTIKMGSELLGYELSGMAADTISAVGTMLSKWGVFGSGTNIGSIPGNDAVSTGTKLYRVWGDEASPWGRSWTTVDPASVDNYRDIAGLPDVNSGRFASEGILQDNTDVIFREAFPLDGNIGGLTEVVVPNPTSQIELENVSGINPRF